MATTTSTKYSATLSASRCTGALVRCASPTMCTMRASRVSEPMRSARMTKPPLALTVPPTTRSPGLFGTGSGSPVTIDSSTFEEPSTTLPSTGIFSPGRTRNRSPTRTSERGISFSTPFSIRKAMAGASASSCRMAWLVCPMARSCITSPTDTRVTMMAAASK